MTSSQLSKSSKRSDSVASHKGAAYSKDKIVVKAKEKPQEKIEEVDEENDSDENGPAKSVIYTIAQSTMSESEVDVMTWGTWDSGYLCESPNGVSFQTNPEE